MVNSITIMIMSSLSDKDGQKREVGYESGESANPTELQPALYVKATVSEKRVIKGPEVVNKMRSLPQCFLSLSKRELVKERSRLIMS